MDASTWTSERCAKRHRTGSGAGARGKSTREAGVRYQLPTDAMVAGRDDEDVGALDVRQCVVPGRVRRDHGHPVGHHDAGHSGLARVPPSVPVRIHEDGAGHGGSGGEQGCQEEDQVEAFTAEGAGRP
jgi:hypothetical protein